MHERVNVRFFEVFKAKFLAILNFIQYFILNFKPKKLLLKYFLDREWSFKSFGNSYHTSFGIIWTVWKLKKVLQTFFPCIIYVKTKWNKVYEYSRKRNLFKKHHYAFPMASYLDLPHGVASGVAKFEKRYTRKTPRWWHCLWTKTCKLLATQYITHTTQDETLIRDP